MAKKKKLEKRSLGRNDPNREKGRRKDATWIEPNLRYILLTLASGHNRIGRAIPKKNLGEKVSDEEKGGKRSSVKRGYSWGSGEGLDTSAKG